MLRVHKAGLAVSGIFTTQQSMGLRWVVAAWEAETQIQTPSAIQADP